MTIDTMTRRAVVPEAGAGDAGGAWEAIRPSWLPGVVMGWTVFTTVFLWTVTTRGLLRPEISSWSVLGWGGSGREGGFWVFPLLAALALLVFHLAGRGRWRPLFRGLLLAWHLALTGIVLTGALAAGSEAHFEGAMWGVQIPLAVLCFPFAGFAALAAWWIGQEIVGRGRPEAAPWGQVDRRALAVALLLLPAAAALFALGEGYDGPTKLATALTVVQWIVLTQALAHRRAAGARRKEGMR
jgi:hypothetical protein